MNKITYEEVMDLFPNFILPPIIVMKFLFPEKCIEELTTDEIRYIMKLISNDMKKG